MAAIYIDILPAGIIKIVGADLWLACLAGGAGVAAMGWFYLALDRRCPGRTIVGCALDSLGPWVGRLAVLPYLIFHFNLINVHFREISDFVNTALLPATPRTAILVFLLFLMGWAIYGGLEVFGRVVIFFFPVISVLVYPATVVMAANRMEPSLLQPVLAGGAGPSALGSLSVTALWSEISFLAVLLAYTGGCDRAKARGVMAGILLGTAIMCFQAVAVISLFGPELATRLRYPLLSLAKLISLGIFLERPDALIAGFWLGAAFCKAGVLYITAVLGISQWLGMRDYRHLVWPVGALSIGLTLLKFRSVTEYYEWLDVVALNFLPAGLGIPLLVFLAARFRSPGEKWDK